MFGRAYEPVAQGVAPLVVLVELVPGTTRLRISLIPAINGVGRQPAMAMVIELDILSLPFELFVRAPE